MKKIGLLTSGGDAPGMNAAVRAVVRYSLENDIEVVGIEAGYSGILNKNFIPMDRRSVSDIIQRGGTILKTSRCPEFRDYEPRKQAYNTLVNEGIDGLVVVGGDGSFRGMKDLYNEFGLPCVGIPGTIDNDLAYTDYTLGFDTAVNTVLSAINSIRDTMTAHNRACILEVMGRHCGDLALYSGLAGGAEIIIVPEVGYKADKIAKEILTDRANGKKSVIIVLAEGVCSSASLKEELTPLLDGINLRTVKLGYIQRGGTPSMSDRVLAARCGVRAVELLLGDNCGCRVTGIKDNKIIDVEVNEALAQKSCFDKKLYDYSIILGK